jgi:Ca2+-binding EF-hand superfamily protein
VATNCDINGWIDRRVIRCILLDTNLSRRQIKAEWDKADTDKSGNLDFKEVVALLDKLNLKLKESKAQKIFKVRQYIKLWFLTNVFQEVDEDSSGHLDFNEFRQFLSLLRSRSEVNHLFDLLYEQFREDAEEEPVEKVWTAGEFLQFLREVQRVSSNVNLPFRIDI